MFENEKNVSFNIASEASNVNVLSGQIFFKNANNAQQFAFVGQKLVENAKIHKVKWDISVNFQTLCQV